MKPLNLPTPLPADSCCDNDSTCCSPSELPGDHSPQPWITGTVETPKGRIPIITTQLSFKDTLGAWKVRWGINRGNYKVDPGLYALGTPQPESPVLVTANYKLTFDSLRKELSGLNLWILVLDTKGVNVWCAAGKGTFGTAELARRIRTAGLQSVVSHRTVILPQLGAPGVSAHEINRITGFKVVYGPVLASDLPRFFENGMVADTTMRTVRFSSWDRLVLIPVELVPATKAALLAMGTLFALNSMGLADFGALELYALMGAVICGAVLTPLLLPWIPGRMFSLKGALLGLLWGILLTAMSHPGPLAAAGYLLLIPAISAYLGMNFTGASTYTSFSGVKKEMKLTVPPMFLCAMAGALAVIAAGVLRQFS